MKALHVAGASAVQGVAMLVAMGWDRFGLALACILAVTTLMLADKLDTTVFIAVVGPVIGYVVGAGHEKVASVERDAASQAALVRAKAQEVERGGSE